MTQRPEGMPEAPEIGSFDTLAEAYARHRIGYATQIYDILLQAGIGHGAEVLDLGCGTGIVAADLTARGARVTGVDVSEPMLAKAASRVPQATFERAAAESLPFARARFDAIVCAQAFHWFDQPRALAECARVVRPGGHVAIWWKGLTRGDAVRSIRDEVARDAGLEPAPDLLARGFAAFESSGLERRELHVVPWNVERTAADVLGYETSRARSRDAYGDRLGVYLAELERRLGPPDTVYTSSYVHYLYLGIVPEVR